jgi:hypothetical protein
VDPTDTFRSPIGELKAEYVERQPNRVSDDLVRRLLIAIAVFVA